MDWVIVIFVYAKFLNAINLIGKISSLPLVLMGLYLFADAPSNLVGILQGLTAVAFPVFAFLSRRDSARICLGLIGLMFAMISSFFVADYSADVRKAAYQLVRAAFNGDTASVQRALAEGWDPDSSNEEHGTLLSAAIISGNFSTVRAVIDAGADPDYYQGKRMAPLVVSVFGLRCEPALALVEAGADPNSHFRHHENYAVGPQYENMPVRELYSYMKKEFGKTWSEHQTCWLKFEKALDNPHRVVATHRPNLPHVKKFIKDLLPEL
ncbi:MAG: ankyrin repeat domain-containing protein [Massilia sp.]